MRLGRREYFAILHTSPQMVTISVSHYWSRLRHPTTNKGRRLSETPLMFFPCAHDIEWVSQVVSRTVPLL
ncbi:hypothetical protein APHAL10511_001513 [Amanita phalloides]|nr:hypothetical protein APHAL10511_001513 [Amanita phalloides]